MAKRWTPQSNSKQLPRVVGYIVGNEINSHWFWSNQGHVTLEEFAKDYHRAVRLVHETVRSVSKWPRIYVSLDHHWNIRYAAGTETQTFSGRRFLDHFAKITNSHGNFDWHVAFHPYPENLFDPSFWDDETATNHFDSPRVTFKNLQVLCDYLRRDELLTPANNPRRVILSEQGFHASKDEAGELLQAAAYCYAYKLIEQQSGIDAFILHRHVDHAAEGGLQLGLWTRKQESVATPDRPRKIYECFQSADGPDWERVFNFALPIIHRSDWNGLSRPISIPADQ
jgi:hypothetical protein